MGLVEFVMIGEFMPKKTSSVKKVAAGLGVAALAAGAAAAYYFAGPKGKKHRDQLSALGKKAKTDMVQRIKGMKTLSKQAYAGAVKEVLAKYKQAKNIDPQELVILGQELMGHWDDISKNIAKLGTKKKTPAKASRAKAKR